MAINSDGAFEVQADGLAITDDNGTVIGYIATASGDPTGTTAPQNTWLLRSDTQTLWYNYSGDPSDWRQIRADDIAFDVSNLTDGSSDLSGLTQSKQVIDALSNRHYGKDYTPLLKRANETTTGTTPATYSSMPFTVTEQTGTNTYRISVNFLWGHNSASNDFRAFLVLDGVVQDEFRAEPKDAGADQRYSGTLMADVDNLSPGAHTLEIQYRPATGSRVSRMFQSFLEVRRTA